MNLEFYKMEFDSWDEGTVELTLEEEAAYLRICHQMYRMHGPVIDSDRLLASLWRCHVNKVRPLLERLIHKGKIQVTADGKLTNTRTAKELDTRDTVGRQRAHAGHTGGIRSGESRRNSLKNKEPDEAFALSKRTREEESRGDKNKKDGANAPPFLELVSPETEPGGKKEEGERAFFGRVREVVGQKQGGAVGAKLLKAKGGVVELARAAVEQASIKQNPLEYIFAIIHGVGERQSERDPRL